MSYLYEELSSTRVNVVVSEFTKSSDQSMSSGDVLTFDTVRSTGSSTISINSSTGVITPTAGYSYWLLLSEDGERSSTSANFSFSFYDQSGTLLTASSGNASSTAWSVGLSATNLSQTAQMVLLDTTQTYSIKITISSGTFTAKRPTLLVVEAANV
jgi:hypothetical protein